MLPIRTSLPPRRKLLSAAKGGIGIARSTDHVESHLGSAVASLAQFGGIGCRLAAGKLHRRDSRTCRVDQGFQRRGIATRRDDARRAHRKPKERGRCTAGTRRAIHDERLTQNTRRTFGRAPASIPQSVLFTREARRLAVDK
jgi:hypothetical protein